MSAEIQQLRKDIYGWLRAPIFEEDFNHPALVVEGVESVPACHIPAITREELLVLHHEAAMLFHRVEAALAGCATDANNEALGGLPSEAP